MSKLSQFLTGVETQIAEGLVTGVMSNSIAEGLTAFLASTPGATLSDAKSYINAQLSSLLASAISKLSGWEQAIASVLIAIGGETTLDSWVDGLVTQAYDRVIQQVAGTKAVAAIVALQAPSTEAASSAPSLNLQAAA